MDRFFTEMILPETSWKVKKISVAYRNIFAQKVEKSEKKMLCPSDFSNEYQNTMARWKKVKKSEKEWKKWK